MTATSRILYLDCASGASGDMILGALLDAGLPFEIVTEAIGSLSVEGIAIESGQVLRAGISATQFSVRGPRADAHEGSPAHDHDHPHDHDHARDHDHPHDHDHSHGHGHGVPLHHHHEPAHAGGEEGAGRAMRSPRAGTVASHEHRGLREIERLIAASALSATAKDTATGLFRRLVEVEASIHQMPVEAVHLHEVGAIDSIVDIVGAVVGFEWFGAGEIVSSPLNVGSGTVRCEHGVLPVPAPATARLLSGVPVYSRGPARELLTPTGALLVTHFASRFGSMPAMRLERVGYGAGANDFAGFPNVLRVLVGDREGSDTVETIVVLECEIDDMNPQIYGVLMERLQAAGAHDVFYAPVQMKKNRPGTLVTVIAPPARRAELASVIFQETTTLGIRYRDSERERLAREHVTVETPLGPIRFKVARAGTRVVNASPEFEECVRIAGERGLPVKEVHAVATKAYLDTRANR